MQATLAPERSAAFNCAFIERASNARSTASPAALSSWVSSRAMPRRARVDDEGVEGPAQAQVAGGQDAFGVAGEQDPLDAGAETHAGHLRAAERGDETVVAAASADALEDVRAVLESRAGVVVETPDEVVVLLVGDREPVQALAHDFEMQAAVLTQGVAQLGRSPRSASGIRGRLQSRMRSGFTAHL